MSVIKNIFAVVLLILIALELLYLYQAKSITVPSNILSTAEYRKIDIKLSELVTKSNPKTAIYYLNTLMQDPKILRSCHAFTHEIGHLAFAKYGSFSEAIQYQDELCGSGYLHGVTEAYFKTLNDITNAMNTVCEVNGLEVGKCYHGIGHGIMFYTDNDLPKSLRLCDTYQTSEKKVRCSEGVFMENFSTDQNLHPSVYLKPDDPMYPCRGLAGLFSLSLSIEYKQTCYFYAPLYFLSLHIDNYKLAMNWCQSAEKDDIWYCTNGVGSRAIKQNIKLPKMVEEICLSGIKDQIKPCIDGMVSYYLVDSNSLKNARQMCATMQKENIQMCLASVDSRRKLYKE